MPLEPVTAVTDDLLAMTWASHDAARTWFKRRKTEPQDLGLEFKEYPSDTGLRVKVIPAATKSAIDPALFDDWANEVDALLSSANEEAESDKVLEDLFSRGVSVQHAFDEIIAHRTNALEAELSSAAEPETGEVIEGGMVELDERVPIVEEGGIVSQEAWDSLASATVDPLRIVEGAEHPGVTEIREGRAVVYPTGNLEGAEKAHVDRQLAKSMEPTQTTYVLPEKVFLGDLLCILDRVTEVAASVRHRLEMLTGPVAAPVTGPEPMAATEPAQEAAQSLSQEPPGDAQGPPGEPAQEAAQEPAQDITADTAAPASTRTRAAREARMKLIIATLERPLGVTAQEMQTLLGWESAPNPWHFREWAKSAARFNDLTDMGLVEGVRRWRLEVRRR